MDGDAENREALAETTVFLSYFKDMPDHRQAGKVTYPLDEILLLCLLAVLAGAEAFTDIARFGEKKLDLLRRFRPYRDGTPAHDHLGDIFATLDAQAFQRCFVAWVAALTKTPAEVIAIDGKTLRRSYQKKGSKEPIHMVSAFAARQRLVLGQVTVAEKSNEIVAIPALLDMLAIEGAIVTIDAMGCQRNIAKKIIDKKADYIIALKGNQGTLREDVEVSLPSRKPMASRIRRSAGTRRSTAITAASKPEPIPRSTMSIGCKNAMTGRDCKASSWSRANAKSMARSTQETRFYITSLVLLANVIGPMIRDHWAVENSLHWIMDMVFRDDECRVRTEHAPANFTTLKHMAQNLIKKAPGKDSQRLKRKTAGWDDDFLASLVAA